MVTPRPVPHLHSHLLALRFALRFRIFAIILMLPGYVAKPVKTHPKNTKNQKKTIKETNKQNQIKNQKDKNTKKSQNQKAKNNKNNKEQTRRTHTHTQKKNKQQTPKSKISEDYYTVTSHIVLRFFCFFWFLWLCLFFFVFLVFGQGGRCKGKVEYFRKRFEATGNFGNFRKQNLSESSEGPLSETI